MTTLEGGITVTDDFELAELMRILRAHGWTREVEDKQRWHERYPEFDRRFLFVNLGYNLRPTELAGAMGLVQLPKLADFVRIRRENAAWFRRALAPFGRVLRLPERAPEGRKLLVRLPDHREGGRAVHRHRADQRISTPAASRPARSSAATSPGSRRLQHYEHRTVGDMANANAVMEPRLLLRQPSGDRRRRAALCRRADRRVPEGARTCLKPTPTARQDAYLTREQDAMTRPRALITGITGMVGSHLAEYLIANTDWDVWGLCRWRSPLANLESLVPAINSGDRVFLAYGDLRDTLSIRDAVKAARPDYVFHLAAQSFPKTSFDAPLDTLDTNIQGTVRVLDAMREFAPKAIVHVCSSSEVFGRVPKEKLPIDEDCAFHPACPYAISKAGTDLVGRFYAEAYGLTTLTTRMFTHTGPRRGDVFAESTFAKQIAMIEHGLIAPVVKVGNLNSLRTVADVRDAVRAYHLLVTVNPIAGRLLQYRRRVPLHGGRHSAKAADAVAAPRRYRCRRRPRALPPHRRRSASARHAQIPRAYGLGAANPVRADHAGPAGLLAPADRAGGQCVSDPLADGDHWRLIGPNQNSEGVQSV